MPPHRDAFAVHRNPAPQARSAAETSRRAESAGRPDSRQSGNASPHRPVYRKAQRGFTLVELIVVVIIIAVLAVIAIPAITAQMRDRRTRQVAQEVALLYRDARMRAMGRGSAVLIRFDSDVPEGTLEMREAVRGGANSDNCRMLPVSSCVLANWNADPDTPGGSRQLRRFDPSVRSEFENIHVELDDPNGQSAPFLDICFTPLGRAFFRTAATSPWTSLTGVPVARIWRQVEGDAAIGLQRTVMLLPNGNARLGVAGERE